MRISDWSSDVCSSDLQELNGLTRTHMKRKLVDQLAATHDFDVPPSMVEAGFSQIWQQLLHEASHEDDVKGAKAEREAEREDYRAIAVRRVRLGLLLSDIGQIERESCKEKVWQNGGNPVVG